MDGARFELEEVGPCLEPECASSAGRTTTTDGASASAAPASDWDSLNRGDKVACRIMRAGSQGILTSELPAGLYMSKYTNATSEAAKRGHQYRADPVGRLPGGGKSTQYVYFYLGFNGHRDTLKPEVARTLARWEELRNAGKIKYPFEREAA